MFDAQTTQKRLILTRLSILYLNLAENAEIDQYNPFYSIKSQFKRAL